MYWAQIKGRFGQEQNTQAQRRIYLAVKYGNRWLNAVIVRKHADGSQFRTDRGSSFTTA